MSQAEVSTAPVVLPSAPNTVYDTGLDMDTLVQLALKTLYFSANLSEGEIAQRLGLSLGPNSELIDFLRREHLCEATSSRGASLGATRYALTSKGVERAAGALETSGYIGKAPVTLDDYITQVRRQSIFDVELQRGEIEAGISHLVLPDETVKLIGQAISSKRATLLYGASGNGKTSAAIGLKAALPGRILIPYAVEVMHEIVQLYDPSSHIAVDPVPEADGGRAVPDRRWLSIERPAVFAAGELAANQLELMLDEVHKTYEAPIQLKANGGLLIIDDFGRQRLDAAYLLNRWVTPLERQIDYLSLHSGARLEVPFDTIPLFVSNRPPVELADDAFLRRIRYKVEIPSPDRARFIEILEQECSRFGVAYTSAGAEHLLRGYFEGGRREMRGCHPRDIVEAIADAARYQGDDSALTPETVDRACRHYFA